MLVNTKAKVGVFSIALGAYLPQFPSLVPEFEAQYDAFKKTIPGFPFPAPALLTCPHSSVILQYRNINLLSIGYCSRPHLRSRLTQGRSALPWKPWIFGLEDSHLYLAPHSGILSSI